MSDRVSMRKVREVLRLHFECGRKQREIARSCSIGAGTASDYLKRARAAGLDWAAASVWAKQSSSRDCFGKPCLQQLVSAQQ